MSDTTRNLPTPAEEDPLVHRYLAGLSTFRPASPHFHDRVLVSVKSPVPEWAHRLGEWRRELAASNRIWKAVGLLALGSILPTVATVVVVGLFYADIAAGVSWFFVTGFPYGLQQAAAEASRAAATVESAVRWIAPTGTVLAREAAGIAALLAGCAFGLARTMKVKKAVAS